MSDSIPLDSAGKGLQRETLAVIKALCEQGVNPQALSQVIKFLRREAAASPQK